MFLLIRAKFFILPALVMWGVTHCQFLNDVQFQKLAGKWMFRDMVETAGVTQDLEWQVQADLAEEEEEEEVEVEVDEEVKEEEEEDTEEANKEEGGDDSPLILRHPRRHTGHVTFGHNDIRPISTNLERSRSAKKEKKEREREERELADVKEEVVAGVNIIIPISFSLLLGCGGDQGKEELTLSLLLDHQQHEKEEEET